MKAACDHQVQDEPQIFFESNTDSLAQSAQFHNLPAFYTGERRHCSAKQKRRCELNTLEGSTVDSFFECFDVDSDVGKLRHGVSNRCLSKDAPSFARGKQKRDSFLQIRCPVEHHSNRRISGLSNQTI